MKSAKQKIEELEELLKELKSEMTPLDLKKLGEEISETIIEFKFTKEENGLIKKLNSLIKTSNNKIDFDPNDWDPDCIVSGLIEVSMNCIDAELRNLSDAKNDLEYEIEEAEGTIRTAEKLKKSLPKLKAKLKENQELYKKVDKESDKIVAQLEMSLYERLK